MKVLGIRSWWKLIWFLFVLNILGFVIVLVRNEFRMFVLFIKELVFFKRYEKMFFIFCVVDSFEVLLFNEEFKERFFLCLCLCLFLLFYNEWVLWFSLFFVLVCGVSLLICEVNFEVGLFEMLWLLLMLEFFDMIWCLVLVVNFEIL